MKIVKMSEPEESMSLPKFEPVTPVNKNQNCVTIEASILGNTLL
jgi:hypothetical protein